MKNIIKATVLIVLVLMVFSCDLFLEEPSVLIASRISSFESSLNAGSYSSLSNHFHPDMTSYDSYLDQTIFTSGPLQEANATFDFGVPASDESSTGYTAVGTFGNKYYTDGNYAAEMRKDGDDWKIYSMVITVGSTPYTIRTLK